MLICTWLIIIIAAVITPFRLVFAIRHDVVLYVYRRRVLFYTCYTETDQVERVSGVQKSQSGSFCSDAFQISS